MQGEVESGIFAVARRPLNEHESLIARAASGDRAAFREVYARHRADVARLVFRMIGARPEADDVIQEVFFQVFRSLKDFRGQSKFTTWLHRVTVNVVLMHRRSAKSRPVYADEAPQDTMLDTHQALPDEDFARHERMRAFRRLLDRLAEKKRIVFILHELEGMAPAEIAKVVGAPILTVRTRLFYARRELEAMLGDEPTLAGVAREIAESSETSASSGARQTKTKTGWGTTLVMARWRPKVGAKRDPPQAELERPGPRGARRARARGRLGEDGRAAVRARGRRGARAGGDREVRREATHVGRRGRGPGDGGVGAAVLCGQARRRDARCHGRRARSERRRRVVERAERGGARHARRRGARRRGGRVDRARRRRRAEERAGRVRAQRVCRRWRDVGGGDRRAGRSPRDARDVGARAGARCGRSAGRAGREWGGLRHRRGGGARRRARHALAGRAGRDAGHDRSARGGRLDRPAAAQRVDLRRSRDRPRARRVRLDRSARHVEGLARDHARPRRHAAGSSARDRARRAPRSRPGHSAQQRDHAAPSRFAGARRGSAALVVRIARFARGAAGAGRGVDGVAGLGRRARSPPSDAAASRRQPGARDHERHPHLREAHVAQATGVVVTVSTSLELHVGDSGMVQSARFDPPLAPDVQQCAVKAIYGTRFSTPGSVSIPIDFTP